MGKIANELEDAAVKKDMKKSTSWKKKLINKPSKKATQIGDANWVIINDESLGINMPRGWAVYLKLTQRGRTSWT